jgi:hypothetical protein
VIYDVAAGHLNAFNAVAAATNRRDRRFAMMTLRSRSKQSRRSNAAQKTAKNAGQCRTNSTSKYGIFFHFRRFQINRENEPFLSLFS